MTDRATQLEQVASELLKALWSIIETGDPPPIDQVSELERRLFLAMAERSLSLAEAVREELKRKCADIEAWQLLGASSSYAEGFGDAASACVDAIDLTPIPIPIAPTQETGHD
jgi:hypothetical protein